MKNLFKCFKIVAFVAVIGFALASCDMGADSDEVIVSSTGGSLTITGLDEFEGSYIAALGEDTDGKHLLAANAVSGETITGGKVTGGTVTLKVWKFVSNTELGSFNGNGEVEFAVDVFKVAAIELHEDHYHAFNHDDELASGHVDVSFTNGVGSGAFEAGEHVHEHLTVNETTGTLTITGLDEYEGKYASAIGNFFLHLAAESVSSENAITCGKIEGGQVVLKVWQVVSDTELGAFPDLSLGSYAGVYASGTIGFNIDIFNGDTLLWHMNHYHLEGNERATDRRPVTVTFTNGAATTVF